MDSPALSNQRGINMGKVYTQVQRLRCCCTLLIDSSWVALQRFLNSSTRPQDGTLAVSVAQEALIRLNE